MGFGRSIKKIEPLKGYSPEAPAGGGLQDAEPRHRPEGLPDPQQRLYQVVVAGSALISMADLKECFHQCDNIEEEVP